MVRKSTREARQSYLANEVLHLMNDADEIALQDLAEELGETLQVTKGAAEQCDELEIVGSEEHAQQVVRWKS